MRAIICAPCGVIGFAENEQQGLNMLKEHFKSIHTDPLTGKAGGTVYHGDTGEVFRVEQ